MTQPNPQGEQPAPPPDSTDGVFAAQHAKDMLGMSDSKPREPMTPEAQATRDTVQTYFDNYMGNSHWGNLKVDDEKFASYRDVFTDLATHYFDGDFLKTDRYSGQEYNPILGELGSMMASLSHNAGVYYSEEDVADLFAVVAAHILEGKELQDQLQQASDTQDIPAGETAFKTAVEQASSLDRETALAVVKGSDGMWRIADNHEYGGTQDFTPLEILRQDNSDKAGWNKYRFRSATYTRAKDDHHAHEVEPGWFTSDWQNDPNYWSQQLREALRDGVAEAKAQLQGTGADILLVSEGGVAKGTSTEGTDIDTHCIVVGDLSADFGQARPVIDAVFVEKLGGLPFSLKKGETLRPHFYDRVTGEAYDFNPKTGKYTPFNNYGLFHGQYVMEIRQNEKSIAITKASGVSTFAKPVDTDPKRSVFAAIDIATGDVRMMSSEEVETYRKLQAAQRSITTTDNVDENWVW